MELSKTSAPAAGGATARNDGEPSRLQRDLAERVIALVRRDGLQPGDRLTEQSLASALAVSRTPVRAALAHLARLGVVEAQPGRGFRLARRPDPDEGAEAQGFGQGFGQGLGNGQDLAQDRLIIAIAQDRLGERLPDEVSEADLMRRYAASRQVVLRALSSLAEVGVMARKPGYGWSFEPLPHDRAARDESYRFRLLVEPAALLEPGFRLDAAWTAEMRARHEKALAEPWRDVASVGFFEMNAGFHEGLALASGNRFIHLAVVHQNRVRRFRNYNWTLGPERVVVNCRQHLEMLDKLEEGDRELASLLMRRHIEQASRLKTA